MIRFALFVAVLSVLVGACSWGGDSEPSPPRTLEPVPSPAGIVVQSCSELPNGLVHSQGATEDLSDGRTRFEFIYFHPSTGESYRLILMTGDDVDGCDSLVRTAVESQPTMALPPTEPMIVGGGAWIDARPAEGEVAAIIDGQQCGRAQAVMLFEPPSVYSVEVASDSVQPGCGVPGAIVTLTLNGQTTDSTLVWHPGSQPPVDVVVGPEFAVYQGEIVQDVEPPYAVVPFIDGVPCGEDLSPMARGGKKSFRVVVDSEASKSGCGRDGADVEIRLVRDGQPDIVVVTVPWQPGLTNDVTTFEDDDASG